MADVSSYISRTVNFGNHSFLRYGPVFLFVTAVLQSSEAEQARNICLFTSAKATLPIHEHRLEVTDVQLVGSER